MGRDDFQCEHCGLLLDPEQASGEYVVTEPTIVRAMLSPPQRTRTMELPRPPPQKAAAHDLATARFTIPLDAQTVPRLRAGLDIALQPLHPFEAHIASFVDGVLAVPQLALAARLPEIEVKVVLKALLERGVVELRREPAPPPKRSLTAEMPVLDGSEFLESAALDADEEAEPFTLRDEEVPTLSGEAPALLMALGDEDGLTPMALGDEEPVEDRPTRRDRPLNTPSHDEPAKPSRGLRPGAAPSPRGASSPALGERPLPVGMAQPPATRAGASFGTATPPPSRPGAFDGAAPAHAPRTESFAEVDAVSAPRASVAAGAPSATSSRPMAFDGAAPAHAPRPARSAGMAPASRPADTGMEQLPHAARPAAPSGPVVPSDEATTMRSSHPQLGGASRVVHPGPSAQPSRTPPPLGTPSGATTLPAVPFPGMVAPAPAEHATRAQRPSMPLDAPLPGAAPHSPEDLLQRAVRLERAGHVERAIEVLTKAIDRAPDAAALHSKLALILIHQRKDYAQAARLLERAVELEPGNTVFQQNLLKVAALSAASAGERKERKPGLLARLTGRRG
ncbi:tetratricopeptide repeat protein [Myxococcus fulvus]|uniref:tetratricopeptide repeat protein n=1 Tax=Myxococcus fulvus TaxID=33 RepID=UPI003B9D533B